MTIKTNRSGFGAYVYRITLYWDDEKGKRFDAHSISELHLAVDHYFKGNHVVGNGIGVSGCPLCRG